MAVKRAALFVVLALGLCACDSKRSSPTSNPGPSSTGAPQPSAPVLSPRPALRRDVVERAGERDLVVVARLLARTTSIKDGVPLLLSFKTKAGALTLRSELGQERLPWTAPFSELELMVKASDGSERRLAVEDASPSAPSGKPAAFASLGSHALRVGNAGVRLHRQKAPTPWSKPDGPVFSAPGRYTLALRGKLAFESGPLAFETAEVTVDVKAADALKSLDAVETVASDYVRERERLKSAPRVVQPVMEDEQGNRVVRFSINDGTYDDRYTEVIVSQAGKVLSFVVEKVFRCVVEGTSIETPDGPRPVEELAVGDPIVAYDVVGGRRVISRVELVWTAHSERIVALTNELRVSETHPVYAGGRWIAAGQITDGAELLTVNGRRVRATPRREPVGATVYDLSVSWPHTLFAGGVLVHNKAAESPAARAIRTSVDTRPTPKRRRPKR